MPTASLEDTPCSRIAKRLAKSIGHRRYTMWFDRSARFDYHDQRRELELITPNRFVADWITKQFIDQLTQAAHDELGHTVAVQVLVQPEQFSLQAINPPGQQDGASYTPPQPVEGLLHEPADTATLAVQPNPPASRHPSTGRPRKLGQTPLNLRYLLDNFVVGPSNELAYQAALRIGHLGQQPQDSGIASPASPLFIHGGCGLGKTHLLQGVCRRVLQENPQAKVMYLTGEAFTNEFLTAVQTNTLRSFRSKIRQLDLLALDDVHFIANKQATQQEFLHCFDAIDLTGARVVLASDCHPKLIKQFSQALISRCVRGLVVEVRGPDAITRSRLIRAIATKRGIHLMDSVIDTLAARTNGSIREIEGLLTKLHALSKLRNRSSKQANPSNQVPTIHGAVLQDEIGHILVNQLFQAEWSHTTPKVVRFATILSTVSQHTGISASQITGSGRKKAQVLARSLVIHLARHFTKMSYPEIATAMGKSAHSSIITADQRIIGQITAGQMILVPQTMEQLPLIDLVDRLKLAVEQAPDA